MGVDFFIFKVCSGYLAPGNLEFKKLPCIIYATDVLEIQESLNIVPPYSCQSLQLCRGYYQISLDAKMSRSKHSSFTYRQSFTF